MAIKWDYIWSDKDEAEEWIEYVDKPYCSDAWRMGYLDGKGDRECGE